MGMGEVLVHMQSKAQTKHAISLQSLFTGCICLLVERGVVIFQGGPDSLSLPRKSGKARPQNPIFGLEKL